MQNRIEKLANEIDEAIDRSDTAVLASLDDQCAQLLDGSESSNAAIIWYCRSNVQAALQDKEGGQSWNWRQPHRERQILYLRRAIGDSESAGLDPLLQTRVITNLANAFNSLGRSVEAIALYDQALVHQPSFAMTTGNRGIARAEFARALYDSGHASIILAAAHGDFLAASSADAIWDGAYPGMHEHFLSKAKEIESYSNAEAATRDVELEGYSLGRSEQEQAYRTWSLEHKLFLNPLNVLGPYTIAATDSFGLPSHRTSLGDPPHFIAWFNRLKQEYIGARLLLFEAEHKPQRHFADREVLLIDTLDYPVFGVAFEKMRLAFRTAYSLLDKVAGFVNAYFELGDNPERVNIRSIWLSNSARSIRPKFAGVPNWPLRGLYWLAMDIVGEEPNDPDAIAPDASQLRTFRNALEHRCLVLREFDAGEPSGIVETTTLHTFRQQTYRMMTLARSALIYLSLAVAREEQMRNENDPGISVPAILPTYQNKEYL